MSLWCWTVLCFRRGLLCMFFDSVGTRLRLWRSRRIRLRRLPIWGWLSSISKINDIFIVCLLFTINVGQSFPFFGFSFHKMNLMELDSCPFNFDSWVISNKILDTIFIEIEISISFSKIKITLLLFH